MNSFLQYLAEHLPEDKRWMLFERISVQTRAQLYADLLEFENSFLKPVLKKYGAESQQFKFLNRVKDTIIQAAEQQFIIENQRENLTALHQLNDHLFTENKRLNTALLRYETIEEMSVAGTLQAYVKTVQENIKQRELNQKKEAAQNG